MECTLVIIIYKSSPKRFFNSSGVQSLDIIFQKKVSFFLKNFFIFFCLCLFNFNHFPIIQVSKNFMSFTLFNIVFLKVSTQSIPGLVLLLLNAGIAREIQLFQAVFAGTRNSLYGNITSF